MDTERRDKIVLAACVGVFVLINVILFITGRFPVRQGGLPDWTLTVGVIVGAFITLAVFSFLYKDNPVFRAVENLFVGLGLGVTVYVTWYDYLKPDIYDRLIAPFFSPTARVQRGDYILLIPILLGIMMLTRISRRYGWISRYPICFLVGYGAGFSIQPTIHSMILKQVEKTMVPATMHWGAWVVFGGAALLAVATAYYASKGGRLALVLKVVCGVLVAAYIIARCTARLGEYAELTQAFRAVDSLAIMLGVMSVLCYFFFSAEHKGVLGAFSRVGIMFLMVAFGASFGYTVMARESLLIGRFQFLLGEWLGLL